MGNALVDLTHSLENEDALLRRGWETGDWIPIDLGGWESARSIVSEPLSVQAGGSIANTVRTVGLLGGNATFVGVVGDDEYGDLFKAAILRDCGNEVLATVEGGTTGRSLCFVTPPDGERTMVVHHGVSRDFTQLYSQKIPWGSMGHFGGYSLFGEGASDFVQESVLRVKERGGIVSFDLGDKEVAKEKPDEVWGLLESVDILFVNEDEADVLVGLPPRKAGKEIQRHAGVGTVVVKRGARGSFVFEGERCLRIGTGSCKVIDTTGAGDAYAGGFLYGILNEFSMEKCAEFGRDCASEAVSRWGALP
ncbi:adenosine kinase [bacterium]|nr:adenosine kinase [bacterium]